MLRALILALEYFVVYFLVVFLASAAWLMSSLWKQKRIEPARCGLESQSSTNL
jgi:hypothetical protein